MLAIIICVCLTAITFALRVLVSGLRLSLLTHKVATRKREDTKAEKVVKFGVNAGIRVLNFIRFILSRVRDLIAVTGIVSILIFTIFFTAIVAGGAYMMLEEDAKQVEQKKEAGDSSKESTVNKESNKADSNDDSNNNVNNEDTVEEENE
jgi:predicted permease